MLSALTLCVSACRRYLMYLNTDSVFLCTSLCVVKTNHLVSALFVHFSFFKKCAVLIISEHLALTQPWLFPVPHLTVGDVSEEGWGWVELASCLKKTLGDEQLRNEDVDGVFRDMTVSLAMQRKYGCLGVDREEDPQSRPSVCWAGRRKDRHTNSGWWEIWFALFYRHQQNSAGSETALRIKRSAAAGFRVAAVAN